MCHVTISLLNKFEKIAREEYNFLKLEAIKFILCQTNCLTLRTTILIGILLRTVGLIRINNTSARTRGFCCKIGSHMSERYQRQMWPTEDILQGLHQYSTVQYVVECSQSRECCNVSVSQVNGLAHLITISQRVHTHIHRRQFFAHTVHDKHGKRESAPRT